MVAWDAVVMDTVAWAASARPVRIEMGAWIGFGACILPGVIVGRGAIVAARAVVCSNVPPGATVAGNPARVVRQQDLTVIDQALATSRAATRSAD
jgi:acetyltransferase-like isoleucine patch superfamily enzyme